MEQPQLCYNIISLNSAGLRTKQRLDTALQFCKNFAADFSILQEIHLGPTKSNDVKNQWEGEVYISRGTTFRDGILLLTETSAPKLDSIKADPKGKYMSRIANTSDVVVSALCVLWHFKIKTRIKARILSKTKKENRYTNYKKR